MKMDIPIEMKGQSLIDFLLIKREMFKLFQGRKREN